MISSFYYILETLTTPQMQKSNRKVKLREPQAQQKQPGLESHMNPKPEFEAPLYNKGSGKSRGKTALITCGDSGIGRAVEAFSREGYDVSITYLNKHKDSKLTKSHVEKEGQKCYLISGDITRESFCKNSIQRILKNFGSLDIIINNAAVQFPSESITKISGNQLAKTFRINIFSHFYLVQHSLKYFYMTGPILHPNGAK
ncbi:MAG: SDR family NAD(P)-dependent oxidoreductase [Ignavibacteria bacterium]